MRNFRLGRHLADTIMLGSSLAEVGPSAADFDVNKRHYTA